MFGKPLVWTRGWAIVVAVWLVCALLLGLCRLQMGHLAALSPREAAAVSAVEHSRLAGGFSGSELLGQLASTYATQLFGPSVAGASPRWYAVDRPWEHRVYVLWELGPATLSFTVQSGTVRPDDSARLVLTIVARLRVGRR
jgi:hypothetical protein